MTRNSWGTGAGCSPIVPPGAMDRQVSCTRPSPLATRVAVDPYMQMACPELTSLRARKQVEQAGLEKAQFDASEHDKAAMYVIHVPVASMSGRDREADVARGKGELQAMDAAIRSKGCAAG